MDEEQLTDEAKQLFGLTFDEAKTIITHLGHSTLCATCKEGHYSLSKNENRATVVNLPVVNARDDLAHWAFFMACSHCGAAKLVDAARVLDVANKDAKS